MVELTLKSGMHFEAHGEDGLALQLDADSVHGGTGRGFRPMELLLAGLGGCTAMDVLSILRKKRQNVTGYRVEVSGVQTDQVPHVFTTIAIRHIIRGDDLSDEAVRRSIELSETKYCPAYAMLSRAASISSTYELHPTAPAD